jgi:hypothetical protein
VIILNNILKLSYQEALVCFLEKSFVSSSLNSEEIERYKTYQKGIKNV